MSDYNPSLTPKGRTVLDALRANPGMSVAEAIESVNALTREVDSSFTQEDSDE